MTTIKQSMKVSAAVIGAGSAGISAFRQLMRAHADAVLIDPGPLGTMCARSGCMPSKALISVANDYHRRLVFEREGIRGAQHITCNIAAVLRHVRQLRDHFVSGMVDTTGALAGNRLIRERATLKDCHTIETEHYRIRTDKTIIATGARPVVPEAWTHFGDRILTSESLFEQTDLPRRLAVIGLKLEGLELGQALGRLGVEVVCFGRNKNIGGVTDPVVNEALHQSIGEEIPIHSNTEAHVKGADPETLLVEGGEVHARADALLLAMGVRPNLSGLGLDEMDVTLDENGMPPCNPETGQIAALPVFLAGDANQYRPVLHEAVDEGTIAGVNAVSDEKKYYDRRVPMQVCFSDPQAVVVGRAWSDLNMDETAIGTALIGDDPRAVLEHRDAGCLRVYTDRQSGKLLGSEMAAPDAEHLGHLLALAIECRLSVWDLLNMPFYHPSLTESVRTALHAALEDSR